MRAAIALSAALLASCAAVRPAERPVTLRLTLAPPATSGPLLAGPIAVAPVGARGLAGSLRYTYVDAQAPAELRQAATLFWEEPPPRVLERALVAGLRARFANVLGPGVPGTPERRAVAELQRMEEVSAGGPARALVSFGVTLAGKSAAGAEYCASAPIAGATPSARADAFGQAMGAAVARFAAEAADGRLVGLRC